VKLESAQHKSSMDTMSPNEASNRPRSASASTSGSDDSEYQALTPAKFHQAVNKLFSAVSRMSNFLIPAQDTDRLVASSISAWENDEKKFCEEYIGLSAAVQDHVRHFPTRYSNFLCLLKIRTLQQTNPPALDQIVYLTNTLLFYSNLFEATNNPDGRWNALRGVYIYFPSEYMFSTTQKQPQNNSLLASETASISLELRTQLVILLFRRKAHLHDFSPTAEIRDVFYKMDLTTLDTSNLETFFPTLNNEDFSLHLRILRQLVARIEEIQHFISHDAGSTPPQYSVDLDGLEEHFPWSTFLAHVAQWVQLRQRELTSAISYWCDFHDRILHSMLEENKELRRMLADVPTQSSHTLSSQNPTRLLP
jgi:hypothetical protein